jgi:23S rRNA (uracil1939-C5)-methyltransferase
MPNPDSSTARDCIPGIKIESLAFGGDGVGHLKSGKAVFVPGTIPGETVTLRIVEEKRSYALAEVHEITALSANRTAERCCSAARCGGCAWQHMPAGLQRQWKERLLTQELSRQVPGFTGDNIAPMIAGSPFGHRTRTRLHVRKGVLGTLPRRSHEVTPLKECPILSPRLESFALDLIPILAEFPHLDADVELYIDARGKRGMFVATETGNRAPWVKISACANLTALRVQGRREKNPDASDVLLIEESAEEELRFAPGVFVQTNREMNARLVATALDGVGEAREDFAEIYAGAGNFTVHLARLFNKGVAVESDPRAVRFLRKNLHGLAGKVEVLAQTDAQVVQTLKARPQTDMLFADPPRSGIKPLYPVFTASPPRRVVLVSCHPIAAVRDIAFLVKEASYRLEKITPLDLFPQTDHFEVVAWLSHGG